MGGNTITTVGKEKPRLTPPILLIYEIIPELNASEWEQTLPHRFRLRPERYGAFPLQCLADRNGIGAVFRLIPSKIRSFHRSGFTRHHQKTLFPPKGLVLVTLSNCRAQINDAGGTH